MSILNTSYDAEAYIIQAIYSENTSKIAAVIANFVCASAQACLDKSHWNTEIWFGFRGQWRSYSY